MTKTCTVCGRTLPLEAFHREITGKARCNECFNADKAAFKERSDSHNWDKKAVGKMILDARLKMGLSLEEAGRLVGIKPCVISSLEKGNHSAPPHRSTQAKLDAALGISLPIPRGIPQRTTIYIPARMAAIVTDAMTVYDTESLSEALMSALNAWDVQRKKVAKWNKEHPENKVSG